MELYGDQRLILEVEAILGRGKTNAKWQSVISPGYRFHPEISFKPENKEKVEEFVSGLPDKLVTIQKNELILSDIKKLPVLESYLDKQHVDYITLERDSGRVHFHFETDGSLQAKDALIHSIMIFEDKLTELQDQLKDL